MDNVHQHGPFSEQEVTTIRCFFCPCGHVCLRWRRALLLHFDQGEVSCALDCLHDVLKGRSGGFSLGAGAFSACRAVDGFYYLLCQSHVVLRLSEDEAHTLHTELSSARAVLQKASEPAPHRIM
jgi:hypothetical protein